MIVYLLILCFLPAILVFGVVKMFKKRIANNPNKKMMTRYMLMYLFLVACVGAILYGLSGLA